MRIEKSVFTEDEEKVLNIVGEIARMETKKPFWRKIGWTKVDDFFKPHKDNVRSATIFCAKIERENARKSLLEFCSDAEKIILDKEDALGKTN